jgi:hypothetical protein
MLSEVAKHRKANSTWSHSHVEVESRKLRLAEAGESGWGGMGRALGTRLQLDRSRESCCTTYCTLGCLQTTVMCRLVQKARRKDFK